MRRAIHLLLVCASLPPFAWAESTPTTTPNAPANTASEAAKSQSDPEVVLLLGMPVTQGKEATLAYLAKIGGKADLIADPILRRSVRLNLAAIESNPDQAAQIRQGHLASISAYFIEIGKKALEEGDLPTAVQAGQLAIRCSGSYTQAKLFYADIVVKEWFRHGK